MKRVNIPLLLIFVLIELLIYKVESYADEYVDYLKGDGKYSSYPYELSRLKKERVVFRVDDMGKIDKVFWYGQKGQLESVCLPQKGMVLLGGDGSYVLVEEDQVFRIKGGDFDNLNLDYVGGAGISDMGVEISGIAEVIDRSKNSIVNLERIFKKYQIEKGKLLDEKGFNHPVSKKHPLMSIPGMNTSYFFDGHGYRLEYQVISGKRFSISSISLGNDLALQKKFEKEINMLDSDFSDAFTEIAILGFLALLFVAAIIASPFIIYKFIKARRCKK